MKLIKKEQIENNRSYDISIKDTNCFFANGILVHNSNAGISYNNVSGLWAQSRESIITPQKDNMGFAWFVESHKDVITKLINQVQEKENVDLNYNTITIYGEWVGKGIQKGVGISSLDKSLFIFGVKISPFEVDGADKQPAAYWVDHTYLRSSENKIYNINDYDTYTVEIDFNYPELIQNKLVELTLAVEDECPVSKAFGHPNTVGEGIVFSAEHNGIVYRFKSKGELHAGKSKVKILYSVDDEKIKKIIEIADKVTPSWRLAQMIEKSCNLMNGGNLERSKLGEYIRLVINDIIKEDSDIIAEAGLEPKDINKYVSEIARKYFFEQEKY